MNDLKIDFVKEIIEPLLNPEETQPFFRKLLKDKETRRQELRKSADTSFAIREFIKGHVWRSIIRPEIIDSLKTGYGSLLRDGLKMGEVEIKNVISNNRASINIVEKLRYLVLKGDKDAQTLSVMESKK